MAVNQRSLLVTIAVNLPYRRSCSAVGGADRDRPLSQFGRLLPPRTFGDDEQTSVQFFERSQRLSEARSIHTSFSLQAKSTVHWHTYGGF